MEFPIHDAASAPEGSRPVLEAIQSRYGFVPNLAGVMASSPGALAGLGAVLEAFEAPTMALRPVERQVVLLAVSVANRCDYCSAAHGMLAANAGLDRAAVDRLHRGETLADERLEALRRFAEVVVESRGNPTAEDVATFEHAGFTTAHVLEVVFGVAVKTFTNYANHIARPPVNEAFAAFLPPWARAAAA